MAHPQMYDDGDPHFQRVRTLALALPEAQMKVSHGRPAFYTTTVFAYYGASVKGDVPAGDGYLQHPRALVVRVEASEVPFLDQDSRAFRPAYLGPAGWFGIDLDGLDPGAEDGWDEVAEWIDASYRLTAPARLVRRL